jgi:hypothetical protein
MIPFAFFVLPHFSSEVFLMSPFAFLGLPASPVRKRLWTLKSKCAMLTLLRMFVYSSRDIGLQFTLNEITTEVFGILGML